MGTLDIELFGKRLRNPVMNASGTLGYGREIEPLWGVETLGAYVTKGLSLTPHHGNPPPRVWEERHGLINSIGLQNIGVERFFRDYLPFFEKKETPIVINFFGFSEDEYLRCAAAITPHRLIVALEMNLSCPNIKKGGISFGKEPKTVHDLIVRVKGVTPIPVVAKLTPEVKNIVEIALAAWEARADGLTIINTMPAAVVDVASRSVPLKGGLSGPILRPIALKAVHDVSRAVPIPVVGVGGIMNAEDALAFLMAGARAVQVGTATFVHPYAIPNILKGMEGYLKTCGLASIGSVSGATHG